MLRCFTLRNSSSRCTTIARRHVTMRAWYSSSAPENSSSNDDENDELMQLLKSDVETYDIMVYMKVWKGVCFIRSI